MFIMRAPYFWGMSQDGLQRVPWKGELGLVLWVLCVKVVSVDWANALFIPQGSSLPSQV